MSIDADQAFASLRANRNSVWPDGRKDTTRLSGVAQVGLSPSFSFIEGERIFTVGSCFARNIEKHLGQLGFDVPALALQLPAEERASDTENDFLNKYPPAAVLNELRWALQPGSSFPDEAYLRVASDLWHDPHSAPNLTPAPLSRVRERRTMVADLYRLVPSCRVFVMTLGLAEAWFDRVTGLYMNGAPPRRAIEQQSHRFRLDVLTVEEIEESLFAIHDLLREKGHPDSRMLLTVSPVPFRATFRGDDAIVANTYSKSALRVAAERFVRQRSGVDYFPSYEIVTHTHRSSAYIQDNRHVTDDVVRVIVERVVDAYWPQRLVEAGPELDAKRTLLAVRQAVRDGDDHEAVKLYASLAVGCRFALVGYSEARFLLEYGKALIRVGSIAEAQAHLYKATQLDPESAAAYLHLGRALARLQRPLEAETAYSQAATLAPENNEIRVRWGRQALANGHLDRAEEAARAVLARDPQHEGAEGLLEAAKAARETMRASTASGRLGQLLDKLVSSGRASSHPQRRARR